MAEDHTGERSETSRRKGEASKLAARDRIRALIVFFVPIALALLPLLLADKQWAARIAAAGGLMAVWGVILIARPVWRVGPFEYISLKIFEKFREDFPAEDPRFTKMADPEQRALDDIYQQIFGPMWVGIGTAVNAFSGLIV